MKINDCVSITFVSADLARLLSELAASNITIKDVCWEGELCVSASISRQDIKRIYKTAKRLGVSVKVYRSSFFDSIYYFLRTRLLLVSSVAIILILSLYLPTRVLFIETEGNTSIPSKFIIEAADACGISFGASRKTVRSEKIKNKLLASLPDLQWAGVNTYGCRAVISVKEKPEVQKETKINDICSIIAATDGIVESITVTRGNTLCFVGQAVKKGQVLVSAYSDLGRIIHATSAEGEIYAQTKRHLTILFPVQSTVKDKIQSQTKKISLIFGKIRINLYKDSGISPLSCDKIYKEYDLTLPGGLKLPVKLAVEYKKVYNTIDNTEIFGPRLPDMSAVAEQYLLDNMISGQILKRLESTHQTEDLIYFKGKYDCLEMIGRIRTEEILNG